MKQDWKSMNFAFVQYKDTDINILAAPDDVQVGPHFYIRWAASKQHSTYWLTLIQH